MKSLTDKAFKGLRVPESKEQSFNCSIHGKQSYTTYQRRDGSWIEPYCPECRRVLHERETLLEGIKQEAKERAVELARHCTANDRSTLMYPLSTTTFLRAKKS